MSVEQMIQDLASGGELEDELEHYGVKGMKWGVRKRGYVKKSNRTTRAGSGSTAERVEKPKKGSLSAPQKGDSKAVVGRDKDGDKIVKVARDGSNTKDLSNDELRAVLDRMRMEIEIKKIMSPPTSNVKKYTDYAKDKFIKSIIDGSASFAKGYVTASLYKGVKMPVPKKEKDKD